MSDDMRLFVAIALLVIGCVICLIGVFIGAGYGFGGMEK